MAVNTERDQLAEDILYLGYLLDVEKNDIKQKLHQRLAQADSLDEVRQETDRWIRLYNYERPHDGLNDMTPIEYLNAA